jgi:hypothetical protein
MIRQGTVLMISSHTAFITQQRLDIISHLTSAVSQTVGSIAADIANVTVDVRSMRLEQQGKVKNLLFSQQY